MSKRVSRQAATQLPGFLHGSCLQVPAWSSCSDSPQWWFVTWKCKPNNPTPTPHAHLPKLFLVRVLYHSNKKLTRALASYFKHSSTGLTLLLHCGSLSSWVLLPPLWLSVAKLLIIWPRILSHFFLTSYSPLGPFCTFLFLKDALNLFSAPSMNGTLGHGFRISV